MRNSRSRILVFALLLAIGSAAPAQDARHSLVLRGVALDRALQTFVDATGLALAYDPGVVELRTVYCVAENQPAEEILRCILRETGLDFVRLSSGTYVLMPRAELPPVYGYLVGNVSDQETGGPIPYAHVYLADKNLGTVSNEAGQFALPPLLPGEYTLSVSHVAYQRWQQTLVVKPGARTEAQPALAAEPVWASPIVIDGSTQRFPSSQLSAASIDLAREPNAAFSEPGRGALGRIRGMSGVRMHDATADIHLQGGESGEHRYELDGVPLFLPQANIGFVGPFSPFALEQLTVHKAGFGVEYGSQTSGVLALSHATEGREGVDLMMDPESLHGRLRESFQWGQNRGATLMASARVGLDGRASNEVSRLLERWGAPDPFLVFAPVTVKAVAPNSGADYETTTGSSRSILASAEPSLRFSDLHASSRIRLSALHSLNLSAYQGRNDLEGGLLRPEFTRSLASTQPPPVTAFDSYGWLNRLAQARFDAVLGNQTLLSTQIRGSRFVLDHSYEIIDSLLVFLNRQDANEAFSTTRIVDANSVSEVGVSTRVDYASDRHNLAAGVEAVRVTNRFNVMMATLPEKFELMAAESRAVPLSVDRGFIRHASEQTRFAVFARDRMPLYDWLAAEAGVRLTYVPVRRTAYAEPRAALHINVARTGLGTLTALTSGGLYRQYVNQIDVSALNAGALLPSVRVWLPVDETVRPPAALHLSQSVRLEPGAGWSLGIEGYLKSVKDGRILDYARAGGILHEVDLVAQSEFLAAADTRTRGIALRTERKTNRYRIAAGYEFTSISRTSKALFDGRDESVPWAEPHRIDAAADWHAGRSLRFNARWQGVWKRSWGFRRAYYDYFSQRPETRRPGEFDLGVPSDHRLPAFYQLDLGAAYMRSVGSVDLQVRLDVLNVLNRSNVLDWRLSPDKETSGAGTVATDWSKVERTLYGRIPTASLRLAF